VASKSEKSNQCRGIAGKEGMEERYGEPGGEKGDRKRGTIGGKQIGEDFLDLLNTQVKKGEGGRRGAGRGI